MIRNWNIVKLQGRPRGRLLKRITLILDEEKYICNYVTTWVFTLYKIKFLNKEIFRIILFNWTQMAGSLENIYIVLPKNNTFILQVVWKLIFLSTVPLFTPLWSLMKQQKKLGVVIWKVIWRLSVKLNTIISKKVKNLK